MLNYTMIAKLRRHVPWIIAILSFGVVGTRDVTCTALASTKRVDALEARVERDSANVQEIRESLADIRARVIYMTGGQSCR
jgi:hypothetical protein